MDRHGNIVPCLDRLPGTLQIRFRTRREMQMAAFLGKLPGARQANSLGSASDECELAVQIQIHANLPVILIFVWLISPPPPAAPAAWRSVRSARADAACRSVSSVARPPRRASRAACSPPPGP